CVAPQAQNRGVGRALITAICDMAQAQGYPAIRLDVAQENHRARALYLRMGFRLERSIPLGLFAPLIGVRQTDVMIRALARTGAA
ncbi:MAG: GNAT family N-acetyltransferase, partial [Rhodobacteraceae bacterium]|nr:GNAT family N-acetyltransferase [Paracoccaceae bacterium]